MASIHKTRWTSGGKEKTAWAVDYFDQDRKKRRRTFKTRREAVDWNIAAQGEIRDGKHTPDSRSITVIEAVRLWLDRCRLRVGLDGGEKTIEISTVRQYEGHAAHIAKSSIAVAKLSRLTMPMVETFKDELLGKGVKAATARKILTSLKVAIKEAQRRGLVAQNVAVGVGYGKRTKRPIVEGEDFPSKIELQVILAHAGQWYPLLVTAAFTGMRSSELRGLLWDDVDFDDKLVRVRRRADYRRDIGDPKSAAGTRTIPLIDLVANALRAHRLASKWSGAKDYVFCNRAGRVTFHSSLQGRGFIPVQIAAGIDPARYGLHSLRHFYASWLIGLRHYSPKELQAMLGHATQAMTFDTYGHLLTKSEEEEQKDRAKLEAASREFRLIAT
jgi:integrase